MSDDYESNVPAILVGLVLVLAVLIGGVGWLAVQRQRAMDAELQAIEEYRAMTAASVLWRDSETVEDVEKAKMLFEEKVGLVKRKGEALIGKNLYSNQPSSHRSSRSPKGMRTKNRGVNTVPQKQRVF